MRLLLEKNLSLKIKRLKQQYQNNNYLPHRAAKPDHDLHKTWRNAERLSTPQIMAMTDGTESRQWDTLDDDESTELYPNSNV